ncbi:O-antigen ligase family protein [Streptosporangium sp. NBC_01756]|uniref:O-antigen ligase family protein n=1 Tax=Streptosporangium sp. NBC_01756 TaxID=2975950 RepID=UPI002DDB98F4|nr:O-antigen ligase family protein [Streptosporangium sp. NBC_01756]WSC87610.1 O-antigen ligase family protein [Streptosporangium sp. NBC_01756]
MIEIARTTPTRLTTELFAPVRFLFAVVAGLAGALARELTGSPFLAEALWALALFVLPLPLLPALLLVTMRLELPGLGELGFSDLVAVFYVVRLTFSSRILDVRLSPSHLVLIVFFGWAVLTTAPQSGMMWPLVHIMLYAVVGVALTHSPTAGTGLLWTVLGLALFETIVHLPDMLTRLHGVVLADPAQLGALLIAALLVVPLLPLPPNGRIAVRGLLLAGIAATQTRSVWFALCVVAVAMLLPRRWHLPVGLPLLMAPPALLAAAQVTALFKLNGESLDLRLQSISEGLRKLSEKPITGHGWAFRDVSPTDFANGIIYNLWVHLGVATGLVGVALFVLYVCLLSSETARNPSAYFFVTAILAMSLTEVPFYGGSVIALLFFALTSVRREPDRPVRTAEAEQPDTTSGLAGSGHRNATR